MYSEERNVLQLLSRLIGLPQNDVKVSLTQGSLAFRVERDLFSGCDCSDHDTACIGLSSRTWTIVT